MRKWLEMFDIIKLRKLSSTIQVLKLNVNAMDKFIVIAFLAFAVFEAAAQTIAPVIPTVPANIQLVNIQKTDQIPIPGPGQASSQYQPRTMRSKLT